MQCPIPVLGRECGADAQTQSAPIAQRVDVIAIHFDCTQGHRFTSALMNGGKRLAATGRKERNTTWSGKSQRTVLLSIVVCAIGGTAILDFLTPVGIVGGMLYGGPIYLTGLLSCAEEAKRRLVVAVAVLCTLLTVLAYFFSPQGGVPAIVLSNYVIAVVAMWMAAALALIHIRLVAENAELRELLPICSYCKQIRDDEGAWHKMETYLHRHAGVEFSHGMCPSCLDQYLNDLDQDPPDTEITLKS